MFCSHMHVVSKLQIQVSWQIHELSKNYYGCYSPLSSLPADASAVVGKCCLWSLYQLCTRYIFFVDHCKKVTAEGKWNQALACVSLINDRKGERMKSDHSLCNSMVSDTLSHFQVLLSVVGFRHIICIIKSPFDWLNVGRGRVCDWLSEP